MDFRRLTENFLRLTRAGELEHEALSCKRSAQFEHTAPMASSAGAQLLRFTRELEPSAVTKFAVVMTAGRDAKDISEALKAFRNAGTPAEEIWVEESCAEQLKRGLAIAHATSFDLEPAVQNWAGVPRSRSLADRVWLRFGRELARSIAEDWSFLVDLSSGDVLEKVFLRRGDGAWWSFGTWLDRPSQREIKRMRGQRGKGQRKLATLPLAAILHRRCGPNRPALKRAVLALNACFGSVKAFE